MDVDVRVCGGLRISFWIESEERRLEARKRLRRWRVRTVDHALVSGICLWEVELRGVVGVVWTYSLREWIGCRCLVVPRAGLEMRGHLARGRAFPGM